MASEAAFWDRLFVEDQASGQPRTLTMRLVRKGGRPWLLLPEDPRLGARVLDLYPAQTLRARVARALLRGALLARVPLGAEPITVPFSPAARFVRFLAGLSGKTGDELPPVGILAGNPATPGQRLILLAFGAHRQPVVVLKAGLSGRACELIEREGRFLSAVPRQTPGIPQLRATFEAPGLHAFALDYFAGRSPRSSEPGQLPRLLSSWVNLEKQIPVTATRAWQELKAACAQDPIFAGLSQRLGGQPVHPTISHGDLAPWNIKVLPTGSWMALDWERGDREGIPAWDWFHYVIQPSILVAREGAAALVGRIEKLCASPEFQRYAQLGGIAGVAHELALAYLLHHNEVVQPSEGLARGRELLALLAGRWLKD